jgi:glucose-6-phosphate dehydrogenase assembly protein OpcA
VVALKLVAAAAAGYVLMRVGWVFFDWLGAVIVVLLLAAAMALAWWQHRWPVAAGLGAGAALSALVLTL